MPRLDRLFVLCFPLLSCSTLGTEAAREARPNVILILTDDQGYGDFGFMGNPVLDTPNIDRLASECPSVERFYVSPVCSPTRACLLTGRYNHRTRAIDTWIGRSMMEPEEVTLAEMLGAEGYRTGIFGKWHLGDCYPLRPQDQGFDEVLVHRGGGLAQPSEPLGGERRYTDPILLHNGRQVQAEGYCTDVYFDAALEFVDGAARADRPFFAYVATNAPHGPYHDVPEELLEKYRERAVASVVPGGDDRAVDRVARTFAMVENIDQNVGRLLDHLEREGLAKETIVVFLNDNGPVAGRYTAGLRGGKTQVYEGGIRTPLLVRWPGRLASSTEVSVPGAHIDLVPTLLDALGMEGGADPRLDGCSLWPLLCGEDEPWEQRHLVLQAHRGDVPVAEHNMTVVGERWKLVRPSGFGRETPGEGAPFELYDLQQDPAESHDLAATDPGRVAELRAVYSEWFHDVSNTREDNYAPPRIQVGTTAERVTWLTRQDWRRRRGGGWGENGLWKLTVSGAVRFRVTLFFQESLALDSLAMRVNGIEREFAPGREGRERVLEEVTLPAGDVDLGFLCEGGGEVLGPYQVRLETLLP